MGLATGFLKYKRRTSEAAEPLERVKHYNEFHVSLLQEEQMEQASRCMDCGVPFCQSGMDLGGMVSGCPLNNLIPEWNDHVFHGNYEEALKRLLKTNSFPEFTSRVCPAPCEKACTCSLHAEGVSIRENELAIIENGYDYQLMQPRRIQARSTKRIAVIGSGPAGLAAADLLNFRGHAVTIFEKEDRPGGLLMYGIPNMKLEKHVIKRRVDLMKAEGIEFRLGEAIFSKKQADALIKEFDAVVLACGCSIPRDIKVSGRDGKGIVFAVDFLKSTTKSLLDNQLKEGSYISAKGKNVLVIGGGDTGNDCVATSIRHGAKSILQLEMMPILPTHRVENNPWPQWPKVLKTDYGQQEAIAVFGKDPREFQTTVKEFILDQNGQVRQAILVKLEYGKDEKSGKSVVKEIQKSEKTVQTDLVLLAAGFIGSDEHVAKAFGVELDDKGTVTTLGEHYKTSKEKVFVAGDMRRGQSLVVWGIREGREAAREVDAYLMGYTNL
ncbi:glutamate synthase subunit beta [Clostridium aminobutyricum]|uniref:Glutamate synthase subunit beta n=1 Tax=Clostridium aminobutyricum TaxID=33953 RepID=A0A939D959_CLOAM|nr:glutamate synthase subunit beta [Clostridium aminobutyricum]MBN7773507.1 glutamate synthase subunit beta [Clostridium aminobutyricum]